jgi:hypothetical protein
MIFMIGADDICRGSVAGSPWKFGDKNMANHGKECDIKRERK